MMSYVVLIGETKEIREISLPSYSLFISHDELCGPYLEKP